MSKSILVCGHGPGISDAVARRFGKAGFKVGVVARSADRLARAAEQLRGSGVDAHAFPCDLGDADAVRTLVREARGALGPLTVLHWNAYAGTAGDLLQASTAELRTVIDVSVLGLVAAVQEALPDLEAQRGSVLCTGGGLGYHDAGVAKMAVGWKAMGLSVAKAAQHKTIALLHQQLAPRGVHVADAVVTGVVKGTAWDQGNGTLDADAIAETMWKMHEERAPATLRID